MTYGNALSPPYVLGASARGSLHEEAELPCQDAFAHAVIEGGTIVAVADGLGSAARADTGATLAVEAACAEARVALTAAEPPVLVAAARSAVTAARRRLEQEADQAECDLREYACTLIVVVARDDDACAAHIGDGGVVGEALGELILVSGPGDSEYVNEVEPLTSDGWEEALRVSPPMRGLAAFAAFTDGCQRAALRRQDDRLEPYPGFCSPLLAFARAAEDLATADEALRALLAGEKLREHSEDDKTLVLAILHTEEPSAASTSKSAGAEEEPT